VPKTPENDDDNIRICLRVKAGDLKYLKNLAKTNSELGYNMLMRSIISDYVKRMRDLERQNNDRQGTPRIEITEEDLMNLDGLGQPEPDLDLKLEF
jgi:hypothetical protein